MEYLPPVGWADVATKRDLDQLAAMTKRDLDQFAAMTKRGLDGLRIELRGEMSELRGEMRQLRGEMSAKMADLSRTFAISMVATSCTTIGAIAAMLALTR
jgi:hypothetical protein